MVSGNQCWAKTAYNDAALTLKNRLDALADMEEYHVMIRGGKGESFECAFDMNVGMVEIERVRGRVVRRSYYVFGKDSLADAYLDKKGTGEFHVLRGLKFQFQDYSIFRSDFRVFGDMRRVKEFGEMKSRRYTFVHGGKEPTGSKALLDTEGAWAASDSVVFETELGFFNDELVSVKTKSSGRVLSERTIEYLGEDRSIFSNIGLKKASK